MMIKEELKFVCRSLFRGRNNGWVKVLTLTLGLSIGIVLFARIAFDLSYERFLPGVENLYRLQTVYTAGMGTDNPSMKDYGRVFRPVAPAMAEEIPGVVAGSSILDVSGEDIAVFCGENRYDVQLIYADTAFFRTLGIPILAGDPARLEVSDQIFLSRSFRATRHRTASFSFQPPDIQAPSFRRDLILRCQDGAFSLPREQSCQPAPVRFRLSYQPDLFPFRNSLSHAFISKGGKLLFTVRALAQPASQKVIISRRAFFRKQLLRKIHGGHHIRQVQKLPVLLIIGKGRQIHRVHLLSAEGLRLRAFRLSGKEADPNRQAEKRCRRAREGRRTGRAAHCLPARQGQDYPQHGVPQIEA